MLLVVHFLHIAFSLYDYIYFITLPFVVHNLGKLCKCNIAKSV